MQWEFIIALLVAIPVILFPVALIWYMNMQGLYTGIKSDAQHNKTAYSNEEIEIRNLCLSMIEEEHGEYEIESDHQ
jgi:hypothetical protein